MTDLTERLSTALPDRYRIERRLGEGGMEPQITQMNPDSCDD
jgi:hypothetical protein